MASDADRANNSLDENRRAERLSAEIKVDYRSEGSFVTDYSANVSREGVFIQTSHPLPVGERVRLRLQLPEGDAPFALDGVVKWVRTGRGGHEPPGMGVQFIDLPQFVSDQLDRLVSQVEQDSSSYEGS